MAHASARRSFHGPLLVTAGAAKLRAKSAPPLSLVPAPPSTSLFGRALIRGEREEASTSDERERILAGMLAALRGLTGTSG